MRKNRGMFIENLMKNRRPPAAVSIPAGCGGDAVGRRGALRKFLAAGGGAPTVLLLLTGLLAGPREADAGTGPGAYRELPAVAGGVITGTVRLAAAQRGLKLQRMEITKDNAHCGRSKASPRLEAGKDGAIANAVVFLEGISGGKKFPAGQKLVLSQQQCEYTPHVMIVPLGTQMEIVNNDPILHNVHAYYGTQTAFNIAQPVKGQRATVKQSQLSKPGIVQLTCDAGHPWMSGVLVVAPHPYYTVTDKNGRFRLENVPPGTYTIRMWHEGVAVSSTESEKGKVRKYAFEEPYELSQQVSVPAMAGGGPAGAIAPVNFELTLR